MRVPSVLKRTVMARGLVPPEPMIWQMLEQLQSGQEGKGHTLEAARTEDQDAWREHNLLRTSIHVLQSKLPLATTFTMSVSSSSFEFSLLDSNSSWELLWKPDPQRSTLPILEPSSFQLHAQSLKQEGLFLWGPKMLLNDL
ncbi:transmembrane protein CCDC163 isoform X1 [Chlorocebus sabaeus]|uniref:transmembrane protein CCDC163 isoform X1 n=1 Tax=Chlorocebus sabaeus TaxID=60711 RepID=UPI0018B09475|nr:transmembrane protein CCDC163 isoform X1 [Chlorocebus sabaeus]XP_037854787.1 transmembrane protein CCDC163 isoform X1 [Chlorocebus sabaeus]XP_037854789.1 transmembrane protein CCDC163 isoform X1 [Chlorocebus sabaeus]XP_037854795.1 transmembrane protein CCDC163 isoform X1 [Chlorocebus sabaeus]XP_037854803.1 transmembrane protein CCDC163 isoform X1 [Chlorocebus sabaeus]XP_037854813.1 transmembrane protein CCDC163 isoform X1 [Chlorocebus sabaeus]XP_037854819.1 transmembrane protein CCDC163 is